MQQLAPMRPVDFVLGAIQHPRNEGVAVDQEVLVVSEVGQKVYPLEVERLMLYGLERRQQLAIVHRQICGTHCRAFITR
jgi:hypothetical protein